ncbi:MAG: alkaline shock response membrane anchor protein AmaP [Actinomycetota bacterium]|nr:alkaline shock response membrane anchor protein AmaP [Actinomycetota bacterium]
MSAFNRLIMLVIALLLIAVPVFLLLVGFGVLSAEQINAYTGYRGALDSLSKLSVSAFGLRDRVVLGIVGIIVALVALLLLLRELTFGYPVARRTYIEDTPGQEISITAQAVRHLAEGAAQEVGAVSPSCRLTSDKNRRYEVSCDVQVARSQNLTEFAVNVRENIRRVLEEQRVPVTDVEVTVRETAS